MSWRTEQFAPSAELLQVVIDRAIRPDVETVRQTLNLGPIRARVELWVNESRNSFLQTICWGESNENAQPNAALRIRFRHTFKPSRNLFLAQLMLNEPHESTGLASAILDGEIKHNNDDFLVKTSSSTCVYNRSHWIDPGRL